MVDGSRGTEVPLAALSVMLDLARQSATGRLELLHEDGNASWIWLRDGQVASVSTPAQAPLLAARMLQAGLLNAETLAEAQQRARTDPTRPDLTTALLQMESVRRADVIRARAEELAELLGAALRQNVVYTRFVAGAVLPGTVAVIPTEEVVRAGREAAQRLATDQPTSPSAYPGATPSAGTPPPADLDAAARAAMAMPEGESADADDDYDGLRPPTPLRVIADLPETKPEELEAELAEAASQAERLESDSRAGRDSAAASESGDSDDGGETADADHPRAVNEVMSLDELLEPMRPSSDSAGSADALRELASLGREEQEEEEEPPSPKRKRSGRGR